MVMTVSLDNASAMTLRFCRFPVEGQTWLWCHIWHDGRFYAFTSHDLPCSSDRLALADMTLDPPGADRRVTWKMKDGQAIPGRLKALVRYEIPVYDRKWQGSFVKGDGPGREVVGAMNDWAGPPDIYAAARARSAKVDAGFAEKTRSD
jgi:hypothetical protein